MASLFRLFFLGLLVMAVGGCYVRDVRWSPVQAPGGMEAREVEVITTGYCSCGACCGWHRNWLGRAVISSGPNAGRAKAVGMTASGTMAKPGTLAADTSIFPFGTIIYIPGYGYGRVEDRGGDIKGYRLDLYFRTHSQALHHGKVKTRVKVWLPKAAGSSLDI